MGNYPTAISLISDHLHRNPTDEEAYNLLLQCYYQTSRYETAIALAKTLLEVNSKNPCFINNLYVCSVLHLKGKAESTKNIFNSDLTDTPFLKYNKDLLAESEATHDLDNAPTLKSKLLFMDYRFRNYIPSTLYLTIGNITGSDEYALQQPIITFGREGYAVNDVQVFGGTSISRRHCIIINFQDDLWLYDLSRTGTYLNGNRIQKKAPLVGRNTIRIGKTEYELTNDRRKLL
jgi:tetratricopeptide (TPR) repeat protein